MAEPARCSSCGQPIAWARTTGDRLMPLDHPPSHTGNCAAHRDDTGELRVRVLKTNEHLEPTEVLCTSHWATCPRADQHRGQRR